MSEPKPRKVVAVLTDDEWRALKIAAIEQDLTVQGYVTEIVLRDLKKRRPRGRATRARG